LQLASRQRKSDDEVVNNCKRIVVQEWDAIKREAAALLRGEGGEGSAIVVASNSAAFEGAPLVNSTDDQFHSLREILGDHHLLHIFNLLKENGVDEAALRLSELDDFATLSLSLGDKIKLRALLKTIRGQREGVVGDDPSD
jgi:hypothetical protein